jgi:hypothetical protein
LRIILGRLSADSVTVKDLGFLSIVYRLKVIIFEGWRLKKSFHRMRMRIRMLQT